MAKDVKDENGNVKDEKLWYFRGSLKNLYFRDVSSKTNIQGRLPKKGTWTFCRFKRGEIGKNEGVVILWGGAWYPNAHYENLKSPS